MSIDMNKEEDIISIVKQHSLRFGNISSISKKTNSDFYYSINHHRYEKIIIDTDP